MEAICQRHSPAALPGKNPAVPQSQFGRFGEEINILNLLEFEAQTIQP